MRVRTKNYSATGFEGEKVDASVTVGVPVPKAWRWRLKEEAARTQVSMQEYLRRLILEKLEELKEGNSSAYSPGSAGLNWEWNAPDMSA